MSRSRHVGLEQAEPVVVPSTAVRRRVALEEAIQAALADGDREMVSRLRKRLAGDEPMDRPRTVGQRRRARVGVRRLRGPARR